MNEQPHVIAFSYAKRALVDGTRERLRMSAYASVLASFHVVVFTRANEGYEPFQKEGNLHLYATNSNSKIGMLVDAYKIGKEIITTEQNVSWVVSAQDPLVSSLVPLLLSRFRNAALHIQVHGDIFSAYFFAGDRLGFLKRWYATWVLKRAKKIRVVSERIKSSLLARGIPNERIVVLPIQADIDQFLAVGEKRVYEAAAVTKFLYVGRLAPEKNIPLLLGAFTQAITEGMSGSLTLLGEGPQKIFLQKEVQRLGIEKQVQFLPWTDAVPAVMATADVLCLSSFHEGYGMVLFEAMATGLPVITTAVGAAGSLVIDGEVGRVVPVGNVAAYAEALLELAGDAQKRERFGRSGYRCVESLVLSQERYLHAMGESYKV
jgi:glycosyltransferase involved in cell wall biosynthesis